jgi:hypothetical protein
MHHYTTNANHKIFGRKTLSENQTRAEQQRKTQYQLLYYRNKKRAEVPLFTVCKTAQQQQQPMNQHSP